MGNNPSAQHGQPHGSSAARRDTRTHTGPAPIPGRSAIATEMIPDQFTSLQQVTHALRRNGLESCNMIVGIDFTKSNEWSGKRSFYGRCLHDVDDSSALNPYESVIDTIGKTLRDFDEDNIIPVYGFGDDRTGDHSVFTFAQHRADPIAGFPLEGIRERYREVVRDVTMAGPTSFAPIINQAVNIVNASGGEYHILVIIADGQVTRSVDVPPHAVSKNEKETIDAITYASQFPLSIIMVGVGDGPWEAMEYFDNYLLHRRFDNFQFVEYHKIMSRFPTPQLREAQFALQALMEVPDQYRIIKEMGLLDRRPPFQYRNDLPRVEVLPPPVAQPPLFATYPSASAPSAPTYGQQSAVEGIPLAGQVYYDEQQTTVPSYSSESVQLDRRTSSAEMELARIQEQLLCPICEDRRKDLVFQCGHETCAKCGEVLQDCPICRQRIQVRIKRYG